MVILLSVVQAGKFKDEIVPVTVKIGDDEDAKTVVIDADDGIRAGVTAESLGKLRPAFDENGSTHAGELSPYFLPD